jgi:PelA/Pel-15E family pectate lyase
MFLHKKGSYNILMSKILISGYFNREGGYNSQIKLNDFSQYVFDDVYGLDIHMVIDLDKKCCNEKTKAILSQDIYVDLYTNDNKERIKIANPQTQQIVFSKKIKAVDEGFTFKIVCLVNRQTEYTHHINAKSYIKLIIPELKTNFNLLKVDKRITINHLIDNFECDKIPPTEKFNELTKKVKIMNFMYNNSNSCFNFYHLDHMFMLHYDLLVCVPKKYSEILYKHYVTGNVIDYMHLMDITEKITVYNSSTLNKHDDFYPMYIGLWENAKNKNLCESIYLNNILSWMFGGGISDDVGGFWSKNQCNMFEPYTDEILLKNKYGTLQNGTGLSFLYLLCKKYSETKQPEISKYISMIRNYLVEMPYENGGIPQYYPNTGGRFELITVNDGCFLNYLKMLEILMKFNPRDGQIKKAYNKSLLLLIDLQIEQNDHKTIWAQQYDSVTLTPASARSFECISLCSLESSQILLWLMTFEKPGEEIKKAIIDGCKWYTENSIKNTVQMIFFDDDFKKHNLKAYTSEKHNFSYLWPRFVDIETNKPLFMNRRGEKIYDINKLDKERRINYVWMGNWGEYLLCEFAKWEKKNCTD